MELAYKSILELKELIDTGKISSKQIWDYFNTRAQKIDSDLHSFNSFNSS